MSRRKALAWGRGLLVVWAVSWAGAASRPVLAQYDGSGRSQPASRAVVRSVSSPAETYTVDVAGHPVNRLLTIRNDGTTTASGVRLVVNGRDWSSLDAMLGTILRPGMTDDQKARAIWQFAREYSYHWWPVSDFGSEASDPVTHFSAYGYGFCSDVAAAMATLYARIGFPVRIWNPGFPGEHVVPEVFYDGAWHMLDADRHGLYLTRDNRQIAGVADLIADPGLVARAGEAHADLVGIYAATPLDAFSRWEDISWIAPPDGPWAYEHITDYTLRPGEALSLRWDGTGRVRNDSTQHDERPPLYGKAELTSVVDAAADWPAQLRSSVGATPLGTDVPAIGPASGDAPAELTWSVQTPYPIVETRLTATVLRNAGDVVEIYASRHDDRFTLAGSESRPGGHRLRDFFVSDENIATLGEDGWFPFFHTRAAGQPGWIVYRVRRHADPGVPIEILGHFLRRTPLDRVGVSASPDGSHWVRLWDASPDQLGYFNQLVTIDDTFPAGEDVYFRVELESSGSSGAGVGSGFGRLWVRGLASRVDNLVWSSDTDGRTGLFDVTADLTDLVAPTPGAASYHYQVRVVVRSADPGASGLSRMALRTDMQVAPRLLPGLERGANTVAITHRSPDSVDLVLTHEWDEAPGLPPEAPAAAVSPAAGQLAAPGESLALAWTPASDPDGDAIDRYHVMVCAEPLCVSALGSPFDLITAGSPDAPAYYTLPFGDWLQPARTYYWRVRARDVTGAWGAWSDVWPFTASDWVHLETTHVSGLSGTSPWLTLSGRAFSEAGIVEIRWDSGAESGAVATDDWWDLSIPLRRGTNEVEVTAVDALGRQVSRAFVVPVSRFEYFLADGAAGGIFSTDIALVNPTDEAAPVTIAFMPESGPPAEHALVVPPLARRTVNLRDVAGLGATGVAARVVSHDAVPLLVERTMTWDATGHAGHGESAVAEPSTRWYFAEGAQGHFDTYVLVANPADEESVVTLRFLREGAEAVETTRVVPARTRATIYAGEFPDLVGRSFAMVVDATRPVVAERAMYWSTPERWWDGGHATAGVPALSRTWSFAEGATGPFFDAWVLVGNPGASPAQVRFTYLLPDGRTVVDEAVVDPGRRLTRYVEQVHPWLADTAFSVVVTANRPVVAERAMYWPGEFASWREGHSASGLTGAHTRWGLAEGRVGSAAGYETFVLVSNADPVRPADIVLRFFGEDGTTAVRALTVDPGRRETVYVGPAAAYSHVAELADTTFGVVVESVNDVPVTVERAMYWNAGGVIWSGGTSVNGIPLY